MTSYDVAWITFTGGIQYQEGKKITIWMSACSYYAKTWPKEGGYASHLVACSQRAKDIDWASGWLIPFAYQFVDVMW